METKELVDEILERVYNGPTLSDDPGVQERIVHSDIWNLIEQYETELKADWEYDADSIEIVDLKGQIDDLEDEIEDLKTKLAEFEEAA